MEVVRTTPPPRAMANTISLVDSSSSPPSSPPQSPSLSDHDRSTPGPHATSRVHGTTGAVTLNGTTAVAHAKPSAKAKGASDTTTAKKPGRKKKDDPAANHDPAKPVKEKKPRKPRDPNAPPKKRQKLGDDARAPKLLDQSTSLSTVHASAQSSARPDTPTVHTVHVVPSVATDLVQPSFAQIGKLEIEQKPTLPAYNVLQHQQQQQPLSRPLSSGQRYDPIRSASAENALLRTAGSPTRLSAVVAPSARASPSIASLIDPPSAYTSSRYTNASLPLNNSTSNDIASPVATTSLAATISTSPLTVNVTNLARDDANELTTPLQSDAQAVPIRASKSGSSQRPSKPEIPPNAPSPKPARQKEGPQTVTLGNGLLSNTTFGGRIESVTKQYAEVPNQCIVIDVPMTNETGNYVNFIREVENKYGFDVAHPRVAEHRLRMAQMAAAGAALDPTLADGEDMPLDESDGDSNVEMGGVDDDSTAQEGKKKKMIKRRANEYDKNDGFVDDTEQMWEEQAMASNNGYFVWSGPLVQEAAKPSDDRTGGTVSKRGRGRGRGGSTRGETSGRGRGRGGRSRGDGTTRKPRITKAERAKLEIEKQERENYAATAQKSAMQAGAEA